MVYLIIVLHIVLIAASITLLRFGLNARGTRRMLFVVLGAIVLLPLSTSAARNIAIGSAVEHHEIEMLRDATASIPTQQMERETPDGGRETFDAVQLYSAGLIRHGHYANFSSSGAMRFESQHVFGTTHGEYRRYYTNGSLRVEGEVIAGKPEGEWTFYYVNGGIQASGLFASGEPVDLWTYHNKVDGKVLTMPYQEQTLLELSQLPGGSSS